MPVKQVTFVHPNHTFALLVAYRWAALLPALWILLESGGLTDPFYLVSPLTVFAVSAVLNLGITVFHRPLNRVVMRFPLLLGADLLFCAGVLALSGGSRSPYYLYALSPLLLGAFLFQLRGALATAGTFMVLYLGAEYLSRGALAVRPFNSVVLITELAGIWLIPILLAFPATLLWGIDEVRDELTAARDELAQKHENLAVAHRQLKLMHDLTVLLQAAPDLLSVQQRVLGAVTTGLGFRKAVVGLVDPANEVMGGWQLYPANSSFPAIESLPIRRENGEAFKALLDRKAYTSGVQGELLIGQPVLNSWLKTSTWMILPLGLREHAVGVLLVEVDPAAELTTQRREALVMVANQAALALGTTILCIDRARRLAVEQERNRIARDIHDTVAQSLFGIVYSLDACISMLPGQAEEVRDELIELRALAGGAHDEVRRSIFDLWPSALTLETFRADLASYVNHCCRPQTFNIEFLSSGREFGELSPGIRRMVYRIAQEALANAARHSGAPSARFCMHVGEDEVFLDIADEGRGFDTPTVLARSYSHEHFGLRGIQERVRAMGGNCEILSAPDAGSRIVILLPLNGHGTHFA